VAGSFVDVHGRVDWVAGRGEADLPVGLDASELLARHEDEREAAGVVAFAKQRHPRDELESLRRVRDPPVGVACRVPPFHVRPLLFPCRHLYRRTRWVCPGCGRSNLDGVSLWEERAGRNEALFREVNERIEELHETRSGEQTANFVCECADDSCSERIPVPLLVYEQVRSNARRFIIHPGHRHPEFEQIVDAAGRFLVVEKHGVAGRVAGTTDPRQ
jgi:hypothetical protein